MTFALPRLSRIWKPSPWARLLVFLWLLLVVTGAHAGPTVGANLDLTSLSAEAQSAALAHLVRGGVASVRLPLDWERVEPRPGQYDWHAADAAVDRARAQGLEIVLVLGPAATWAVDPGLGLSPEQARLSVPKSDHLWKRYVRAAATHFRGRVRHWQVREQPSAANFRGAVSEYLHLLNIAARALRSVDLSAVVILPETVALDPAGLDRRLQLPTAGDWEVWGAYLPTGADLTASALALSVMTAEVMPSGARRPIWVVGADDRMPADRWMQYYLLAGAFGIERYYAPAGAISAEWVPLLSQLCYAGFLRLGPDVWALAFQDRDGGAVLAWSQTETRLPASALAPIAEAAQVARAAPLGGAPGSAVAVGGDDPILLLNSRPIFVRGLDFECRATRRVPTRTDVLSARPGPDPRALPAVSVDYSRTAQPEQGLYNRALRVLPGGAIREEPHPDRLCLATNMRPLLDEIALDQPWIYFDIDDRWLYFARGKTPVAVTLECEASRRGPERIGFNLYYDAVAGYRSTPWQWVEAGEGWRKYRVVLSDGSFTNRNGYDFRINAKGSKQDLWVASVRVEKLPATQ